MMIHTGEQLGRLCTAGHRHAFLCAPYIKAHTLHRVLTYLRPEISLTLVTQWTLEDVASGVTDVSCWELVRDHAEWTMLLYPRLHAKYYRVDDSALVGSANLTDKGLGWADWPNAELLVQSDPITWFESEMRENGIPCSDYMAHAIRDAAAHVPQPVPATAEPRDALVEPGEHWVPTARHPGDVVACYLSDANDLTSTGADYARKDLDFIRPPSGLTENELTAFIRGRLLSLPIVQRLDSYLQEPRRFGEVAGWLQYRVGHEVNSTEAWQTWMRWLLYFFPERYRRSRPRHTEFLQRVG